MKQKLVKILSFFRWRIVAVRYITLVINLKIKNLFVKPKYSKLIANVEKLGYAQGPDMSEEVMSAILEFYKLKIENAINIKSNQPFVNIMTEEDLVETNPLIKYAFSEGVLGKAIEYYRGNISLNAIQLLYSYPSGAELKESQYWHKDYGDSKSFHAITYLNDVLDEESGPFTFVDKIETKKISWSPFVRRIPDDQFEKELGSKNVSRFYGKKGSTVMVDPSVCYHYGSRGIKPRLAVFITFSSTVPFTPAAPFTDKYSSKIRELGKLVRPDLNPAFFDYLVR